jgi:ribosomal protein L11 methyltransferase
MNWLEVSLTVDSEMAEAVAEVLARYAPSGVVIESTQIEPDPEGEGRPTGPLRVCAYLPVDDQLEETRRRIEEGLWHLSVIQPMIAPQFRPIEETNWAEAWMQHYKPISIGERLVIVPAWLDSPDDSRIPIRIDPGMAFGTGTHPTTQLVLELLETLLLRETEFLGADVFDVGCGSGILSIAATMLGAGRAFGVDTDPDAIDAARENAATNKVTGQTIFVVGSVDDLKVGVFEIQQAPVVLANMIAPILMRLLDAGLADLVAPGGTLILSGILEEQMGDMLAKLEELELQVIERGQIEDWVALTVVRRDLGTSTR